MLNENEVTPITTENILFDEDTDLKEKLLNELKKWILEENNENINLVIKTDLILLYFLRNTKYNIEKSKKKLIKFAQMRIECTEWFTKRNPFQTEIQELLQLGVFLPLDKKDDQHRQVVVIRTGAHNPKTHSQNDVFKVGNMILDLLMTFDESISHYGIAAIFDMTGVTMGHALQLTPALIKKSVQSWHNYPTKTKLLEFVNAPYYINVVLNTFRLFMSAKMKSRLFVKSSTSDVKTELPKELGGNGKSYEELAKYWKQLVEENSEFYETTQ